MFKAIRRRFNATGLVVVLALVFAMGGGAYAASRYVITSTKQISPKVLKSLKGATGPTGPAGAVGLAGPTGATGAIGATGTGIPGATGSEGPQGKEGTPGKNGKNGTFGDEPLPAGKTLTGVYMAGGYGEAGLSSGKGFGVAATGVSFALPVAGIPNQHYISKSDFEEEEAYFASEPCKGTSEEEQEDCEATLKEREGAFHRLKEDCPGSASSPAAAEGNLCVFEESEVNLSGIPTVSEQGSRGESTFGFTIHQFSEAKGFMLFQGTWAVTG